MGYGRKGLTTLLLTFLAAAAGEALVAKASEAGTDERGYDEQPELRHGQRVLGEDRNAK